LSILQQNGETEAANSLIQKIKDSDQYSKPIPRWIVANYTNDTTTLKDLEKDLSSNNYLKIIHQIKELEKR
jgi:hypothetical protein